MRLVDNIHLVKCKYYDIGLGIGLLASEKIILIDSGVSSTIKEILNYLKRIKLKPEDISTVVNTHGHQDHIGGNALIKESYGARIFAHNLDVSWIQNLEKLFDTYHTKYSSYISVTEETKKAFYWEGGAPCQVTNPLSDGDIIEADGIKLKVIHTPGHSPGSICLYNEENRVLFTGDSIQGEGVLSGESKSLPTYLDFKDYLQSLRLLENIDAQILVSAHPFKPFKSMILYKDEIYDLLSRSKERAFSISQFIDSLLEETPRPIDLAHVTLKVSINFLGTETLTVGALSTVEAHLRHFEEEGKIRLRKKNGRTIIEN